jgi:hypothetical protein
MEEVSVYFFTWRYRSRSALYLEEGLSAPILENRVISFLVEEISAYFLYRKRGKLLLSK